MPQGSTSGKSYDALDESSAVVLSRFVSSTLKARFEPIPEADAIIDIDDETWTSPSRMMAEFRAQKCKMS